MCQMMLTQMHSVSESANMKLENQKNKILKIFCDLIMHIREKSHSTHKLKDKYL